MPIEATIDWEEEAVFVYTGQQKLDAVSRRKVIGIGDEQPDQSLTIVLDDGNKMQVSKADWDIIKAKWEELNRYQTSSSSAP